MLLSIIVLTCNQKPLTLRMLASVAPLLEELGAEAELILVDNGSSDGTLDAVHDMECLRKADVKTIANPVNAGVAAGRNIGLRKASGRYLLLLDNDTVVTAGAIRGLIGHLDDNPACGLCAPALVSPQGGTQASAKQYPGLLLKARHILRPGSESAGERRELSSPHPFYVIGACQMFRREVLDRTGLLDEKIFYGPEDADFCIRIRQAGYTVDYLPHLTIVHDWQRATRRTPFSRLSRRHFKALLYFYRKHRRWL